MSLSIGTKGRADDVVTEENTALAMGSGLVPVYATPCMIALMECAAINAVAPSLEPGQSSVGTHLDVDHDAATPIGMKVWAQCELTGIDGKFLTFSILAYDDSGLIGKGTHQRCLVNVERFLAKAQQKKESSHVH